MIYCEYCGSQLDDSTKFCPHCGAKVTTRPNAAKTGFESRGSTNTNTQSTYKEPSIKGFGLGFLITFLASFVSAGIIGIVALVLVMVAGDSQAKKGALFGFLLPIIIAIILVIIFVSLGVMGAIFSTNYNNFIALAI